VQALEESFQVLLLNKEFRMRLVIPLLRLLYHWYQMLLLVSKKATSREGLEMPIRVRSFICKCMNSFHVLSWGKARLAPLTVEVTELGRANDMFSK
jgi:hypothetical protein